MTLNRTFSCRDARAVSCSRAQQNRLPQQPKHISNVATSQTKGDASIRNLPSYFGSRKRSRGIEFENGFHFNRT